MGVLEDWDSTFLFVLSIFSKQGARYLKRNYPLGAWGNVLHKLYILLLLPCTHKIVKSKTDMC